MCCNQTDRQSLNEEAIVNNQHPSRNSPKTSKHPVNQEFSSRAAASKIIQQCVEDGLSLATLLPRYLGQMRAEHRPLAQEISFGVLR